jgi:hypothetical protein
MAGLELGRPLKIQIGRPPLGTWRALGAQFLYLVQDRELLRLASDE